MAPRVPHLINKPSKPILPLPLPLLLLLPLDLGLVEAAFPTALPHTMEAMEARRRPQQSVALQHQMVEAMRLIDMVAGADMGPTDTADPLLIPAARDMDQVAMVD
jgi:hypothetical protein